MNAQCDTLLICGSLRAHSVNAAVLKTAQQVAPLGIRTRLYGSLADLPHFNPDDDRTALPPVIAALRSDIGRADALLFCTPEYAGALPGSFKNLLDWTVGGGEMDGKAVAWINAASSSAPSGGEDAHISLRKILGYAGARIVEPACVRLPLSHGDVGADGILNDESIRGHIAACLSALASHIRG